MTCRCQINGGGMMSASGSGTGGAPRVLTLSCFDAQVCVSGMFDDVGFEYDPVAQRIVVPTGTTADFVLTAVGDGTAVWAAKP